VIILQLKNRKINNKTLTLIVVWIILFAFSMILLETLASYLDSKQNQNITSSIWSGYVVSSDLGSPQPEVTGIRSSWIVPYAFETSSDTYSSAWIGIGGFQPDKTLIQTGTEHDYVNGREFYSAWYEILPDQAIRIEEMTISPGDLITASIELVNQQTNEWRIEIIDITKNQEFSINLNYNSSKLTAEWIVERPTVNNQISSLANFGTINFTECYATINEKTAAMGDYPHSQVTMTNDLSLQLASVSSINQNKTSFIIQYNKSS
jgi:hypothetical protein